MSSPLIALQDALIERLREDVGVTALVPALNILDRNARPILDRSITVGTDQGVDAGYIARDVTTVYHTLHIWKKENGLIGAKFIEAAITKAIKKARFEAVSGFHFVDVRVSDSLTLREAEGDFSHGVVTVTAIVQEVA